MKALVFIGVFVLVTACASTLDGSFYDESAKIDHNIHCLGLHVDALNAQTAVLPVDSWLVDNATTTDTRLWNHYVDKANRLIRIANAATVVASHCKVAK